MACRNEGKMKKVSGKIRVGAAGILLAGMLAVTGCGEEAGGTALSPTPAGSTGNAEPSLTPAGNADDTQNSENSDVQDMGTDFNEGTGDTENGDASGTSTENEAAGSDVNESDSQGNNYEGLTPADFTIRVADNAGTQSRGTAGQILATGEDLKAISRENIIFYFTNEFKEKVKEKNDELREEGKISDTAGIVLGAANNIYDIELWIGDECIYTGNLKKYLCYEESGFMAWNRLRDWPYYGELTLMDDGGAFGDRTVYLEAAAKLHAFAKLAGLEQESNPIPVTEFGWCYTEQEYFADLDGDGEQENFFYGQSTLLVDGVNYIDQMKYRDNPETEGFFLWDIDPADAYIEIIIWSHGPSNDDYADVYYYDGKALNYAGFLPGVPGEVIQNGDGTVR